MLHLSHVLKRYGALCAVDDLSLTIRRGEIFGLLGPNGAGKSTTVNMICGLLAPDAGEIRFNGEGAPSDAAIRRRIGVAPQELAIYLELSAEENVRFFARLYGLRGAALAEATTAALRTVGLSDRRRERARTFSGGMKRRLNLAAAIAHRPELLILDEPTVGVDPQSRNAILENVLDLRRAGCTVIYTTHYMEEAQRLCDRIAIIDRGRLLALGTVDELLRAHGGRSRLIAGTDGGEHVVETDDPLAELARLRAAGRLRDFRVQGPDLESVFLHLTGRTLRDE
ncbi:MAG: ABC transporter ATP-binding protein [Phycisphaerae bacterium]|jgi:ABC-2 type transport system ATP-binding protein